jgi:hypothetical protein
VTENYFLLDIRQRYLIVDESQKMSTWGEKLVLEVTVRMRMLPSQSKDKWKQNTRDITQDIAKTEAIDIQNILFVSLT